VIRTLNSKFKNLPRFKKLLNQPEGQGKFNDLVDVAIQSSSKTVAQKQPDGSIVYDQVIDDDTLWAKTLLVNSNTFSRMMLVLKEWERMGQRAIFNMNEERAKQFHDEVAEIGISYRRAIDAKSSESSRDAQNSQSTYVDKINKNKVERVYTTKGQKIKGGIMDSILGRDKEDDMDNDRD
jgi:hypothetical protein